MNANLLECCCLLMDRHLNIAFAESATTGKFLKEDLLHVPHKLIEQFTAASEPVTEAIAVGLKQLINADIYIDITGLPSPGGSEMPVDTMFVDAADGRTPEKDILSIRSS